MLVPRAAAPLLLLLAHRGAALTAPALGGAGTVVAPRFAAAPHARAALALAAGGPPETENAAKPGITIPFFGGGGDVPEDQQPAVALQELRGQPFLDWAVDDEYEKRLFSLWTNVMLFLSLPIAFTTFNQIPFELPQLFLAANIGTLFWVMLPFVVRQRLSWGFVSKRLRERELYYEQNERGFFARKDSAESLRDRLLDKEEVRPALRRIDASILSVVGYLVLSLASAQAVTVLEGEAGPTTLKTLSGDASVDYTNRLRRDPAFAAQEQARARRKAVTPGSEEGLKPVYCDSRYYKILAGGNSQGGVGCGGQ